MKKLLPILTCSTLLLSLYGGTVQAGKVNYNGSDCVARSGSILYDFDGAAYNNSTTTSAYVLCHVPHTDFDSFLNNGEIDSGWVDVVDKNRSSRSNNGDANCRFRGHSVNGSGTLNRRYGSMGYSSGFGTHRQRLSLGGVGEDSSSNFTLACHIPRRDTVTGVTKVHVYRVNQ